MSQGEGNTGAGRSPADPQGSAIGSLGMEGADVSVETSQPGVCYYGGVSYSEGSMLKMEGILRSCTNGKWV